MIGPSDILSSAGTSTSTRYGSILSISRPVSPSTITSRENHGAIPTTHLNHNSASFSEPDFSSSSPPSSTLPLPAAQTTTTTMGHLSTTNLPSHSSLEIVMPSDKVFVKGVGSMAEPALLSGNLVLSLSEPTSIKEITLHLRGKARLPVVGGNESSSRLQSNYNTSVVYAHEWRFLAGEQRSAHTLKAGRHVFPFQVEIDATVPSTLETHNSSLGISYKLRATAVRTGLVSNNFHAHRRISIMRSLALDALEYQQTLEIENSWPGKIMYSIAIPHKAWAAGDTVCALVKFSPLRKGVSIKSVVTTVNETMKIRYTFGTVDSSRCVASIKQAFGPDGKPYVVDTYKVKPSAKSQGGMFHVSEGAAAAGPSNIPGSYTPPGSSTPFNEDIGADGLTRPESPPASITDSEYPCPIQGEHDVVALLPVTLPTTLVPSHSADPVDIHYRIRWVVGVLNPDGHVSELRCSLPLMILHHSILTESRLATNETRRLLFAPATTSDGEGVAPDPKDIELPSYDNHVLDRIANSFFPSNASRVNNIWTTDGMNSALYHELPQPLSASTTSSGPGTPFAENDSPALEWVNSELMTSLGESWRSSNNHLFPHGRSSRSKSGSESEATSRRSSRPSSRASSPRREERERARERSNTTFTHSSSSGQSTPSLSSGPSSTSSTPSTRQHSIFNLSLKPFTSLTSRSSSSHSSSNNNNSRHSPHPQTTAVQPIPLRTDRSCSEVVLMSAFSEVPDYDVASRGFLGGGIPPLESLRGLPSYEDSERRKVAVN